MGITAALNLLVIKEIDSSVATPLRAVKLLALYLSSPDNKVNSVLEEGKDVRLVEWKADDIEILNTFQLLTAKHVVYLVSETRLCDPAEIHTESVSLAEEAKADAISALIDRRNVPNRDTPLHLAVKFGDDTATEMLMLPGADWSLQNEQGWIALQEAICNREETIAKIIVRHYQPLAWAKWCRRLPLLIGTMRGMRDFYMEISFH